MGDDYSGSHAASGTPVYLQTSTNLNENTEEWKPKSVSIRERRRSSDRRSRRARYNDFETIDWLRDLAQDRQRSLRLLRLKKLSFINKLRYYFDKISAWLCVALVGLATGFVLACMDIGTTWMTDLKEGVCSEAFWLNREQCCWAQNDSASILERPCKAWKEWGHPDSNSEGGVASYLGAYMVYTIWAVTFACIAVMLPKVFAPYASGSGVPEIKTILSGFIMHRFLGYWTLLIKALATIVAVASGLSLGKEGPMVHVACAVGNVISRLFPKYAKNDAKRREILSASCAAGIACAFNAPVGGVLFSLEEVSYYFPLKTLWRSFFCAMVAAYWLKFLNPYGTDSTVLFNTEYKHAYDNLEIVPFVFLGVFGGLWGSLFINLNIRWCKYRKTSWLGQWPVCEVLTVACATAMVCYPLVYTRLDTAMLIRTLVSQCTPEDNYDLCGYTYNYTSTQAGVTQISHGVPTEKVAGAIWQLALALLLKTFLTIITIGMKLPAGLYIPSMAVGALMGRITGIVMQYFVIFLKDNNSTGHLWLYTQLCGKKGGGGCINPGLYAMVGAAATLGGTTRMTVALVVIMFELTGGLKYIIPIMVAVLVSKWVGDAVCHDGINEAHIRLNGYPYLDNKDEYTTNTKANQVMRPQPGDPPLETIRDETTVNELEQLLKHSKHNGFPVVAGPDSTLVGMVSRRELHDCLTDSMATDESACGESVVHFTDWARAAEPSLSEPSRLSLKKLVDFAPITVSEETPMESIIEMFKKLGLRQVVVCRSGCLRGIITKKDVLDHIHTLLISSDVSDPMGVTKYILQK